MAAASWRDRASVLTWTLTIDHVGTNQRRHVVVAPSISFSDKYARMASGHIYVIAAIRRRHSYGGARCLNASGFATFPVGVS
jgi:hypothetical protein